MKSTGYDIALVGATGLVGATLLRILEERNVPVRHLRLFASARSAGAEVGALGRMWAVREIPADADAFADVDLAFFAAGESVSRRFAASLAQRGTLVIDKSAAFRLERDVPLIVPEVNLASAVDARLIANPNCSTIPLAVAFNVIQRDFGLRRLSLSTYQSISGAGREALAEFEQQLRGGHASGVLPRRSAGNVFPEVGPFDENGDSDEERKIALELNKILGLDHVPVSATTVRVPVAVGHSEAVAFETVRPATRQAIAAAFAASPGVRFGDGANYMTPGEAAGSDDVFVGRLRADKAHAGGFLAWIVCDNLRKGAATNAVQIAEALLARRLSVTA
ncbi:MAG: aspartate-semialdehyde dehydrogenase [Candidatus Eremiobacteraeota bacterium]|nr:aspartate-semialdehyde dehydrogenase [Candidatus Eremiobacteraeota bacterium]